MILTQFIRERSNVELERGARDGTLWRSDEAFRFSDETYDSAPGCLLCNLFDIRDWCTYYYQHHNQHSAAEDAYIRLACRNGEAETGALIARLCRRELGRRATAAIGELSPDVAAEVGS